MYTNAATLVLNIHGSAVDVTSYHIGATFFRQINSTINLAAQPLQPAITAMNALEDRRRLASTVLRGGRYALWVSMILASPLTLYADVFIDLYLGDKYSIASMIIVLFMITFPFTQPTSLLAMTAMATRSMSRHPPGRGRCGLANSRGSRRMSPCCGVSRSAATRS